MSWFLIILAWLVVGFLSTIGFAYIDHMWNEPPWEDVTLSVDRLVFGTLIGAVSLGAFLMIGIFAFFDWLSDFEIKLKDGKDV